MLTASHAEMLETADSRGLDRGWEETKSVALVTQVMQMQFPEQVPHTVWVTACFILVFSVCLCSFSPSPAMGDVHLAALFSWGDVRTVYFEFYRDSASLSHCAFICSSDRSKDQQRCPWSQ